MRSFRLPLRATAAALGAALLLAPAACEKPTDDLLLRFTGFHTAGSPTASPLATLEVDVGDGKSFLVDATFENRSESLNVTGGGTGIRIYSVQVSYQVPGSAPPASTYATDLYVPAGTSGTGTGAATTPGTAVLAGLPLVPAETKDWIDRYVTFDVTGRAPLTVEACFFARTDAGQELRVDARMTITLTNGSGGGGGGGGSTPVVTVVATQDADTTDPSNLQNGIFIISRTGSTAEALVVNYSTAGSTAAVGTDYVDIGSSNTIPAGSSTRKINVVINASSNSGLNVELTIQSGSGYTVGSPSSDTVIIN